MHDAEAALKLAPTCAAAQRLRVRSRFLRRGRVVCEIGVHNP